MIISRISTLRFHEFALPAILVSTVFVTSTAQAADFVILNYDADAGEPATAEEIQSPTEQGFLEQGSAVQGQTHDPTLIIQEGIIHMGVNAWRNSDDGPTNPGYAVNLSDEVLQAMHDFGWQYTIEAAHVRGGHFTAWGVDATNPWGTGGIGRIGVAFGNDAAGAATLDPVSGPGDTLVNLGPGSLGGGFFRVVMSGEPGTANYTFEAFDFDSGAQIGATQNLSGFAASNAFNDNRYILQAGSSAGTGAESYIHSMR
jgi:hypothetical protein